MFKREIIKALREENAELEKENRELRDLKAITENLTGLKEEDFAELERRASLGYLAEDTFGGYDNAMYQLRKIRKGENKMRERNMQKGMLYIYLNDEMVGIHDFKNESELAYYKVYLVGRAMDKYNAKLGDFRILVRYEE